MQSEPFQVRIERQDHPTQSPYWQTFLIEYESGMNITSVLQRIAAHPTTIEGAKVAPVAYDANCLEEVCGSCTMLINGRVRQACSALVDRTGRNSELRKSGELPSRLSERNSADAFLGSSQPCGHVARY